MQKSTVIYGPPGCGKSTAIIKRMRAAVEAGLPERSIGLCSFTKAAAQELADRVGIGNAQIGTLHSFAYRACGLIREQVVTREHLKQFSEISKIETTGASVYDQEQLGVGDHYLAMYGYMRSVLVTDPKVGYQMAADMGNSDGSLPEFVHFIKCYEQWKEAYGLMDFADMLDRAVTADPPNLRLLFLDEAQDFSPAQWRLIESWLPAVDEVVLALDDDQTLYKFTGADPEGGPDFETRHGSERVVLNQSWRVPSVIHALAHRLIHNVRTRVEKEYLPVAEGGEVAYHATLNSVPRLNRQQTTLVLYRNHSLRKELEERLQQSGVPYVTDNGAPGPLQSYPMMAVKLWIEAQENHAKTGRAMLTPRQWQVLERMASPRVKSAVLKEDMSTCANVHWDRALRLPRPLATYFASLERKFGTPCPDTEIHLSTIHGSKGREADRVVLLNAMSNITAEAFSRDPDPEIRAFYVAVTRTKKRLDIIQGENPLKLLR